MTTCSHTRCLLIRAERANVPPTSLTEVECTGLNPNVAHTSTAYAPLTGEAARLDLDGLRAALGGGSDQR